MVKVQKRDGKLVPFNSTLIVNAILKAQEEVGESDFNVAHSVAAVISAGLATDDTVAVPIIQAKVEDLLMVSQPNVARAYIEYRSSRDKAREKEGSLATDLMGLVKQTNKLLLNENANKDAKVFPVQRDLMAGIVSKHFARNYLIPKHIVAAHDDGDIHLHDADYAPFLPYTNCCLVDLKGLFSNGFKLGNAQIEAPKSIGVACAVMAQITAQVASHQYGGTTFANVDQVLAPFAEKSWHKHYATGESEGVADPSGYANRRTEKEIYDGMQSYEYEINTLFTTNGQFPFVTITFGMGTSWFEKKIQEAILKVRIKGLGKDGITAVFPKLVMFVEKGLNLKPEDPNYDIKQLALECSAKRLYPDIISAKLNRDITGSPVPVSPMGA